MTHPQDSVPCLGFGLGLRIPHYAHIQEHRPAVDWFEIISENFMDTDGKALRNLDRIRAHYPIVMHGVSMSIGSIDAPNSDYLRQLRRLADRIEPAWMSDHLCWTGVAHRNLHDLLPLPYTEPALEHLVSRVQQVQDVLGRAIALENPSTYLAFTSSHIPEAEFLAELCRRSGCHLLLDVNNVYVSCFNHRQDPLRYLDALPLDRVVQIHLSGHSHCGTHIIDTHDSPVVDAVWSLYEEVLRRAGRPLNTMIEWDADIPPWDVLYAELDKARRVASEVRSSQDVLTTQPAFMSAAVVLSDQTPCATPIPSGALPSLSLEQQRLQDAIVLAESVLAGQPLDWVQDRPDFGAAMQLEVYRHAYRARLQEVTGEDYPALEQHLGTERFHQLLQDFIACTPSVHYNIARYSAGLPAFVARTLPDDLLAHELAVLEDTLCQLHDAQESEALTPEHLAGLTEQDLAQSVLLPRCASRLLVFSHPLDAYYTALREDQHPPRPQPSPSHLLVFRHDDVVWRMPLEANEHRLLHSLAEGTPVAEATARLVALASDDEDALQSDIGRWFSRWIRNGVLRHSSPEQTAAHRGKAVH